MAANVERDWDIERRALAGEPYQAIGELYSLTRERVRQIVAERGLPGRLAIKQARVEAAADWLVEGAGHRSKLDAMRKHEVSRTALDNALARRHPDFEYRRPGLVDHQARVRGEGEATCIYCGETKPYSEMRMDRTKDGTPTRGNVCQECNRAGARASYYKNRHQAPVPTVTEKECTRCKEVKPASEFHLSQSTPSGLQSWCNECHAEHRRF